MPELSWILSDMVISAYLCLYKDWEREKEKTGYEKNQNILICKKIQLTLIKLWFIFLKFLGL